MKKLLFLTVLLFSLGGLMAQMQDKLVPASEWATFMACTESCSQYLDLDYSSDWIYGVTGFAWLLDIYPGMCPSGPTAFDNSFLRDNAKALGLNYRGIWFTKADKDLAQKQKDALAEVGKALKDGQPTFGLELDIPEYYLIVGTDEDGYLYFDLDRTIKHCAWDKIATSDIGYGEFYMLSKSDKIPDTLQQVLSALAFLRTYNSDPSRFALPGYTMGTGGYDVWIKSLQEGNCDPLGVPYNTWVWSEARSKAAGFLREVREKLGNAYDLSALDSAIISFDTVDEALQSVCAIYSFPPNKEELNKENAAKAATLLTLARDAEKEGIAYLLQFDDVLRSTSSGN